MTFDPKDYPPEWEQLREAVKARAGKRCEQCGVANHAVGARDRHGVWHDEDAIHHLNSTMGGELFGTWPKMIRIVCTTAHLFENDKMTGDLTRLAFLCQRCHLNYDRPHHLTKAAQTRERKRRRAVLDFEQGAPRT